MAPLSFSDSEGPPNCPLSRKFQSFTEPTIDQNYNQIMTTMVTEDPMLLTQIFTPTEFAALLLLTKDQYHSMGALTAPEFLLDILLVAIPPVGDTERESMARKPEFEYFLQFLRSATTYLGSVISCVVNPFYPLINFSPLHGLSKDYTNSLEHPHFTDRFRTAHPT